MDAAGKEHVLLFSDGCVGQNKNTNIAAMLIHTLKTTYHLRKITQHYFEISHSQCEGDSMHSVIEKSKSLATEIFVPSQYATLIQQAKKSDDMYSVNTVGRE